MNVSTRGLPSSGPKLLKQFGMGQHFVLHVLSQGIKFGREIGKT
jgi:hypothetical protein